MHDRGMIKWAPFSSVINSKYLIKEIEKEKTKINKPILSDDEILNIEKLIKESFYNRIPIYLKIYQNGYIKEIKGTILKIDSPNNRIILNNNLTIHFCEITKASLALL